MTAPLETAGRILDEDADLLPVTLQLCEHCGSEGRIYREVRRHWHLEPQEIDCGECPACEGTGLEMIEVEPVEEEEIMS